MREQSGRSAPEPSAAVPPGLVSELLSPFVELLPVAGASVSVVAGPGQSTLGVTDSTAAKLEQLQFDLGEGPHWEALRSGREVLIPDVREQRSAWPVFAAEVGALEIRAVFAFPLNLGAVTVGVIDLYASAATLLSPGDVATARSLTTVAADAAVRLAARAAHEEEPPEGAWAPELRRVVHQATGMLLVQLGVTATEAFATLRARAYASGVPLESVAQDVVARRCALHSENTAE